MADKATTYVPMTGVDMLHYAVVTTDTSTEYAAEDPVPVPGATEVGFNVNAKPVHFTPIMCPMRPIRRWAKLM